MKGKITIFDMHGFSVKSLGSRLMSSVARMVPSVAMAPVDYAKMGVAFTRTHPTTIDAKKAPHFAGGPNLVHALFCVVDITAAWVAADTITVGYLPNGAVPIGGYYSAVDIDTGAETLDVDLGIAANGVDSADADFFTNSGVLSGDAIATDLPLTNAANLRLLTGPFPVTQLGAKTQVLLTCVAASNGGHVGKMVVCINYLMPGLATS